MRSPVAFLIYKQYKSFLEYLTQSEKGDLLDLLFEYAENGTDICPENKAVAMAFNMIKTQVDINVENYEKRVNCGKKGGAPKGNKNACKTTENNLKQPKTTKI